MKNKSELEIDYLPIAQLKCAKNNSRTHSDLQINQIVASIKEFGFTNPVLIDEEDNVIAGHGRLMAAQRMSLEKVPAITLYGLSDAQKRAYLIADNKLALNANWDFDVLREEILALEELNFDVGIIGFDDLELKNIFCQKFDEELKNEEINPVFEISVTLKNEAEQQDLYNFLTEKGYKCRILSM